MNKLIAILKFFEYLFEKKPKTRVGLEKWQDKKVKKFIKRIIKKSEFYKELYKNCDINDWKNLPIIDKKDFMENFDKLNTVQIKKDEAYKTALEAERTRNFTPEINNITVGLSSGTSGNRGIFLVSEQEKTLWALYTLNKILPRPILRGHRIAFFLRADSNLYESMKILNVEFHFFDLLKPFNIHFENLNKYQPTLIISPPSALRILAKAKEEKVLNIHPRKIYSVAEVLEEIDKDYIEKTFNQKLHQAYQATEGFIAATCEYGTLHINEDILAVQKEFIDKERFIPIITDFSRETQPVIRYRLNDILTIKKEPCKCGSCHLAIERIEGRCDDIFYLDDINGKKVPIFPDFLSRAILYSSDNIQEYKIEQHQNSIKIFLKISDYIDISEVQSKVLNEFKSLFDKLNLKEVQIEFCEYHNIDFRRKLKRIERKII
jgi:putative adenylate-forming enzyme